VHTLFLIVARIEQDYGSRDSKLAPNRAVHVGFGGTLPRL